ncbi:MAG: alpha/beta hydrolase [Anaerolineae bacterium]|nr:alpha/beta hydrolase [Anaerolineae bacterium]
MNRPSQTQPTTLHRIIEDLPTFATFILGAAIFFLASPRAGWLYALIYLAYCAFALTWFMRFICSHCLNAYNAGCPSLFGGIASRLFKQRPPEAYAESFKHNIAILYPCWFVPPIVALYQLVTAYSVPMLIALIAFALIAFVVLPLLSKGHSCTNCAMAAECPRMKKQQPKSANPKFRFRGELLLLDETARAAAPGQFVKLTDGFTHYELAGPSDGTAVVLIHGFSVPLFLWDPTFAGLVDAGFHVLRYDLFGRGYSDRPDTIYNQALYDRQLRELLNALGFTGPVNLVGLSMGGAIAVGFTAQHPERVRRLALIDPAGMPMKASPGANLVQVPWLGEWIFDRFAERLLVAGLAKDFYVRDKLEEFEARYRVQMQYRGFKRALLSTYRYGPITTMADAYRKVGQQTCPVLLIWGRNDKTVPFPISEKVRAAIPRAEFHPIDGTGHIPHYEKPEIVNPLLTTFFRSTDLTAR